MKNALIRLLGGVPREQYRELNNALARERDDADKWLCVAARRGAALYKITQQETFNANATVRRMARIAKEAIDG